MKNLPIHEVVIVMGLVFAAFILPQLTINATVHGDYRSFEKWKASVFQDHKVYHLPVDAKISDPKLL